MVGSGDCKSQVQLTAWSEVHNQELHLIFLAVGSWYLLAAISIFLLSLQFLFSAALQPEQLYLLKELCPFHFFFQFSQALNGNMVPHWGTKILFVFAV